MLGENLKAPGGASGIPKHLQAIDPGLSFEILLGAEGLHKRVEIIAGGAKSLVPYSGKGRRRSTEFPG